MLPTGNTVDEFDGIPASCIDVGNPCVFVPATALAVPGDLTPIAMEDHPSLLQRLDSIRRQAGVKMGIADSMSAVPGSVPKIAMVSTSQSGAAGDFTARAVSVGQPHRAVPITVALALAAAARIPDSTVHAVCAENSNTNGAVTIAHASGTITVKANVDLQKSTVSYASVFRTARLLMKGEVYWKG